MLQMAKLPGASAFFGFSVFIRSGPDTPKLAAA